MIRLMGIRSELILALSFALTVSACSLIRKPVPKAVPVRFPGPGESVGARVGLRKIGTVMLVNEAGKFVLIETGLLGAPGLGVVLKTVRGGADTGSLSVSNERRGSVITADIVSGSPARGDDVMQ